MVEYIKCICVFVIIGSAVTNIFPDSDYLKYVKMIFGILLVCMIFEPLNFFLSNQTSLSEIISQIFDEGLEYNNQIYDVEEMSINISEYESRLQERLINLDGRGMSNEQIP